MLLEQLFIIYTTAKDNKENFSPITTSSKFISHYVIRTIIHYFTTANNNKEDFSPITMSSKFIIVYVSFIMIYILGLIVVIGLTVVGIILKFA